MSLLYLSYQNIKAKPFYTTLSVITLALSMLLFLSIQQLKSTFQHQMDHNLNGIDLVIGAKGSPLQLVLASVFHLENPTGNIKYGAFENLAKNPMVSTAVPISFGDNYKGYRIVGTTDAFLNLYEADMAKGTLSLAPMKVVIGHAVAQQLQLKIGDQFQSAHGLTDNALHHHDDLFTVVGILKPNHTVINRLIVTDLSSIWELHEETGHHHEDVSEHEDAIKNTAHELHDEQTNTLHDKDITSILIQFRNPQALLSLPRNINRSTAMQAALPKYEMERLFNYIGIGVRTVSAIALFILILSGLHIFVSFYKMVKDGAFDLALMRTYGASRTQLFGILIYKGFFIITAALTLAILGFKGLLLLLSKFWISHQSLHLIQPLATTELLQTCALIIGVVFVAIISGVYPLFKMNISTLLKHEN